MSLSEMVGKLCAGNRAWENRLVAMGHRSPNSAMIRRWCASAAQKILQREPAAVRAAFTSAGLYTSVRLDQPTGRDIYFHGVHEPLITRLIQQLAKPGQTWLDVGAGTGYFAMLLAKAIGDAGKVIAFESNAELIDRVKSSIVLNGATNVAFLPLESCTDDEIEKLNLVPDGMRIESIEHAARLGRTLGKLKVVVAMNNAIQLTDQLKGHGFEQSTTGLLFIHKSAAGEYASLRP